MTHTAGSAHREQDPTEDPATHWEARYAGSGVIWSGRVNATTADAVSRIPGRGRALDLGSGEGGDAVWLAEQGWTVTAVDISPTAVARGRDAARARGLEDQQITWVAADLAGWTPSESYDLVTASFLHSNVELARIEILRNAAGAISSGGHLVMVTHAEAPPWAPPGHHHEHMPTPEQDLAALALPEAEWAVVHLGTVERAVSSPDGDPAVLRDGVTVLRRR